MKWLIGCDPELFLKDPKTGRHVPACGIVPGDKLEPFKVKKGTVQVDGLAAEIGIDPASSASEFADNVQTVLEELKKFTGDLEFDFSPAVFFNKDVFEAAPPEGKVLGCDPDYNAYNGMANPTPVPNPENLRTASGHIHIGWGSDMDITELSHFRDCCEVAKQMDWYLGLPGLLVEDPKKALTRRNLYGAAGAFRVKSYGCEYRTPSNFWLTSRELMEGVYNNTVKGMNKLFEGIKHERTWPGTAQQYINTHDISSVHAYMHAGGIPYLNEASRELAIKSAKKAKTYV